MGLGALKARWERAFNAPKIIQIDLQILAGDDFENIILKLEILKMLVIVQQGIVLKINRNDSIILGISMKC